MMRRMTVVGTAALIVLAVLTGLLFRDKNQSTTSGRRLVLFCAAGMRLPLEKICAAYLDECGVHVDLQYGGSNTLLNQLQVSRIADLYLAADDAYLALARAKGLVAETLPIADMEPVVITAAGNPLGIQGIDDLLQPGVRVALGSPEQAAIGKQTKAALEASGHWDAMKRHVSASGVFKPTVPDVANSVLIGSVDAGIVWSATAAQYSGLVAVRVPELKRGASRITVGVTAWGEPAADALRFARYIAARDRGLPVFAGMGYEPVEGDPWAERPEITVFAGAVNRKAMEPVVQRFEAREGVSVNTVYNGCGILTAQMRTIRSQEQSGFPDVYVACDVYYLDAVKELFGPGANLSETDIVVAVAPGNPKRIRGLADLAKPGIRVAVGQPEQCTIGVLTRRLLEETGLYETLLGSNVVAQTPSSAMLVPTVTTGAADAALVYRTDTLAESNRIDVVAIESPLAKAVQPLAVAHATPYPQLAGRLYAAMLRAQADFEAAGFRWRMLPAEGGPVKGAP
jgi:molybdate transport system substrate-binding protein